MIATSNLKTYSFTWTFGPTGQRTRTLEGVSPVDALNRNGFGPLKDLKYTDNFLSYVEVV